MVMYTRLKLIALSSDDDVVLVGKILTETEMLKENQVEFKGWHGTSEENAKKIEKANFKRSLGDRQWYGEGAYFFVEGLGNPIVHAKNWVVSEAFKTGHKRYAILKAEIHSLNESVLDLREANGLELFLEHQRYVLREIRGQGLKFKSKNPEYTDGKVFDHLKQKAEIDIVLGHLCIKFGLDRIQRIITRIPNCTVACVSSPEKNIDLASITIDDTGDIEPITTNL